MKKIFLFISILLLFSYGYNSYASNCFIQEQEFNKIKKQYDTISDQVTKGSKLLDMTFEDISNNCISKTFEGINMCIHIHKMALGILKDNMNILDKLEPTYNEKKAEYDACLNSVSNDPLSGYQYYLNKLGIKEAWQKVKNNNQVIVAIIDDGININHPDLKDKIWVNPKAKYGDNKVIDFVGDGLVNNATAGEHGTMVAGIIGATIDNNEGIAGIAKNVKLMPLRVFDTKGGATEESIINAMNFAINNGANIINLSLGQTQFQYSDKFDTVMKRAFDSGIVVVIAAGNGDIMSNQQSGVNLDINPIAPVCNNENKYKYSIGVYAINEYGTKTKWSNYGNCAPFYAYGTNIISTSIPMYNSNYGTNYNSLDGTSFSAPIITGVIALGYNQYGWINPNDIYDALGESIQKKSDDNLPYVSFDGTKQIDVSKYIDILGLKLQNAINNKKIVVNNLNITINTSNQKVILQDVNLRYDAGTGGKVIMIVKKGKLVEILEYKLVGKNKWYKIKYNSNIGWISYLGFKK